MASRTILTSNENEKSGKGIYTKVHFFLTRKVHVTQLTGVDRYHKHLIQKFENIFETITYLR